VEGIDRGVTGALPEAKVLRPHWLNHELVTAQASKAIPPSVREIGHWFVMQPEAISRVARHGWILGRELWARSPAQHRVEGRKSSQHNSRVVVRCPLPRKKQPV
jgi:hypothetical protein